MEMTSESFKKVHGSGHGPQAVSTASSPQYLPEADRFVALASGFRDAFGDRLEESFEPPGPNAAQNAPPEKEMADGPDRPRSICRSCRDFEDLIFCGQDAAQDVEHPLLVQGLQ